MRWAGLFILSAGAAAVAAAPPHARGTVWSVSQGTWGCAVSSPADWPDRTVLSLGHGSAGPSLEITTRQRGFEPIAKASSFPTALAVLGQEGTLAEGTTSLVQSGADQESDRFRLDVTAMERIAGADTPDGVFELRASDGQRRSVALGGVAQAWASAKACLARADALLLDARPPGEAQTADPRRPVLRSRPGALLTRDDYPSRALREEAQGFVSATLIVDRYGQPSACTITQSSGFDSLDKGTCDTLMRRARFYPARDAEHRPVEGNWSRDVDWRIAG